MQILTPSISHTVFYIRRYNLAIDHIVFTDEETNTSIVADSLSITETVLEWYNQVDVDITEPLVNNTFYMMYFYDASNKLLHKDKVYVTDQPIPSYSVNTGVYDFAPSTDNDYIIYEQ